MSSESPSPGLNELITKLKTSMPSIDTQNVTKTLLDTQKRLKTQNFDLLKKTQLLEKENKKLSDLLKKKDKIIGLLNRDNKELEDENDGLKNEVLELKKANAESLNMVTAFQKMVLDYGVRVSGLEKLGRELVDSAHFPQKNKNHVVESSRKQISSEKGKSQVRTNHKLPDIIQIDDAEDKDENDQTDVLAVKRKRGSSNVKVEDDSDEERCVSVLRRRRASKELQSNDHANIIEKHTKHWEAEPEMIIEFGKSYELCMNAVCALHRQNIYVGAYLLPRINRLAELLIDGDPERKLKKTPSELNRFELDQCRLFAGTYSAELFKVYQENADPFFPPRS